jgi:dihydrofolate synthase / folylpolyglutamate synthase
MELSIIACAKISSRSANNSMRYQEAVEFLYKLQQFGANFGLERSFKLAELAGRPQDKLKFIHVAGTNGKGSTCAMLESIYRHAGYKTGLFTSPHLISFAERIQVNRQLIPEPEVARFVAQMRDLLKQLPEGDHPTFFEVVTIMALIWFAEQKCDIVIWETGLGGRLDATNIVTPLASVITNISLDHEKWLGHTLAEIAGEKAGIIKPNVPVLTAVESDEAFEVIQKIAAEKRAPLNRIVHTNWKGLAADAINLMGVHQQKNAELAIGVAEQLHESVPVSLVKVLPAVWKVQWPGRFDIRGRYILDGAHNPAGAQTLRQTLEQTFPSLKPTLIVGILADKDIAGMARELVQVASRILTVSVHSDRAADAQLIADQFRAVAPNLPVESCASLAEAIQKSEGDERVVITGSLHFIGEAMEFLGFEVGQRGERALNDWSSPGR